MSPPRPQREGTCLCRHELQGSRSSHRVPTCGQKQPAMPGSPAEAAHPAEQKASSESMWHAAMATTLLWCTSWQQKPLPSHLRVPGCPFHTWAGNRMQGPGLLLATLGCSPRSTSIALRMSRALSFVTGSSMANTCNTGVPLQISVSSGTSPGSAGWEFPLHTTNLT